MNKQPNYRLYGVPDLDGYSKLHYPHYDLQDLGTIYKGDIPSDVIKVTNVLAVKIPQPYPVKIPHSVPVPVHIKTPYPVPVTKIVQVPQPYPVEIIKNVQVPVEVPKPYPVPENEYKASQNGQESAPISKDPYGNNGGYHEGYGGDHVQISQALQAATYEEPNHSENSYGQGNYNSYDRNSQNEETQNEQSYGYPSDTQVSHSS